MVSLRMSLQIAFVGTEDTVGVNYGHTRGGEVGTVEVEPRYTFVYGRVEADLAAAAKWRVR